jgi:beta-lactamase regulating signal transducer with metallopeptidase domain
MFGWSESAWISMFAGVALKSTVVFVAAGPVTILLHKCSAAARHLVWLAAAVAVLLLPLLSVSLPPIHVPMGRIPAIFDAGVTNHSTAIGFAGANTPGTRVAAEEKAQIAQPTRGLPDWRQWLIFLWIIGSLLGSAQMLVACASIRRVRRSSQPFGNRDLCRTLAQSLGIRREVRVLETGRGTMPMTFGLLRPTVYIPSLEGWSEGLRRVVLLHELAHVARNDSATHLLARAALNLYWWNPLAWMAWRGFLKERERAADNLVLGTGEHAPDYASNLLEIARTIRPPSISGLAATTMGRRSQMEGRLLAILDSGINRKTPGRTASW